MNNSSHNRHHRDSRRDSRNNYSNRNKSNEVQELVEKISFGELTAKNVSDDAEDIAIKLCKNFRLKENTINQFRNFYDELDVLSRKLTENPSNNNEIPMDKLIPIKMLIPKIAYAKGRDTVTEEFYALVDTPIKSIKSVKEFLNYKLFMEAVLGFFKLHYKKH